MFAEYALLVFFVPKKVYLIFYHLIKEIVPIQCVCSKWSLCLPVLSTRSLSWGKLFVCRQHFWDGLSLQRDLRVFMRGTQVSGSGRGGCSANRKGDLLRSFASRSPLFRSATRPVKYILGGMSPLWLRFPFTPWLEQSEDNYFTCACGVQGSGGWSCQKTVKSRPSCDCTWGRRGTTASSAPWI